MDTDVISRAMRDATGDLALRSDFTGRVLRGGRRRARHRRIGFLAGAAALVALAGAGSVAALPGGGGPPAATADARLDQPTGGDLAGDVRFRHDAVLAWRRGIVDSPNAFRGIFDDLRGEPRVYWAGDTPAGRAAVVLQRTFLHSGDGLSEAEENTAQTLVGLVAVDPRDGRLKLVGDQYQPAGDPAPGRFQLGPGDRTVLVLGRDVPLYLSPAARTQEDGRVVRDWQRMTVADGVAVAQLPEGAKATAVRVLARANAPTQDDNWSDGLLPLELASEYLVGGRTVPNYDSRRLPWSGGPGGATPAPGAGDARVRRVGTDPHVPGDVINSFGPWLTEGGFLDVGGRHGAGGGWAVAAGLPDGRTALVGEYQDEDNPSNLYAVLVDRAGQVQQIRRGRPVDPAAILPVLLRMPDVQGWVVAAYGSNLRYRTAPDGQWLDGGADAALLPDAAIQVRVTPEGGVSEDVPLPR